MKKLVFLFTLLVMPFTFIACNDDDDDDRWISAGELPVNAEAFLNTHFPDVEYRLQKDNDSYDAYLNNGFEVEFDLTGEWDDVDGKSQAVPQTIVALLPGGIPIYISTNYNGQSIYEINKERFGYEIELSNRIELEFDTEGNFIHIDK